MCCIRDSEPVCVLIIALSKTYKSTALSSPDLLFEARELRPKSISVVCGRGFGFGLAEFVLVFVFVFVLVLRENVVSRRKTLLVVKSPWIIPEACILPIATPIDFATKTAGLLSIPLLTKKSRTVMGLRLGEGDEEEEEEGWGGSKSSIKIIAFFVSTKYKSGTSISSFLHFKIHFVSAFTLDFVIFLSRTSRR